MVPLTDNVIVAGVLFKYKTPKKKRGGRPTGRKPTGKTKYNYKKKQDNEEFTKSLKGLPYADRLRRLRERIEEKYECK